MRKNSLIALAVTCAAAMTIASTSVQAQPTNAPAGPVPAAPVAPRPNAQYRLYSVRSTVGMLDRVLADLKRSDNDFDGHKQSAIDACMKARDELMAVAKAANIPIPAMRGPGHRPMGVPPPGGVAPVPAAPPVQSAPAAPQ